jgi:hypothetical protein
MYYDVKQYKKIYNNNTCDGMNGKEYGEQV